MIFSKKNSTSADVRPAAWSGQFYPANPEQLRKLIEGYLAETPNIEALGRIIGIIAPHAGYEYSGKTAAAAYRQLGKQAVRSVIIMAPSHTEAIDGVSVFNGNSYETPLGQIEVDKELAAAICNAHDNLHLSDVGHTAYKHRPEHALEVHLPFLQTALAAPFTLVPMVFNDYSWTNCQALGLAIANAVKDREPVLLVASTDLYHGESYDDCIKYDSETINAMTTFDPQAFLTGANLDRFQACGAGPVAAMQVAARAMGAKRVQLVARTNSADMTGQHDGWTVGYASALITE